jgi:ATP-dependent helicase/nuclease subunit A
MELTQEQQAAVESFNHHCVVSAGAGSGKTRVLVERYLRLLERSEAKTNPFPHIVAITFTEKAAAEMKSRIRDGIRERAQQQGATVRTRSAPPWEAWLTQVEGAQVMTFHAFCAQLLREFPVEASVDPHFQVADGGEAEEWLEQAVRQVLTQTLASGEQPEVEPLLLAWGATGAVRGIVRLYREMAGNGWSADELAVHTRHSMEQAAINREQQEQESRLVLFSAAEELIAMTGGKRLQRFQQEWPELAETLRHSGDDAERLRVVQSLLTLVKGNWGRDEALLRLRDGVKESAQAWLHSLQGRLLASQETEAVAVICDWLQQVAIVYTRLKEERGALDFDELQQRAVRLLRDHPQVTETLRRRIRWLMVDEFQDTNPIQKELVEWILPGPAGEIVPGKGFVVGDSKQSIYRFRGADVSLFADLREEWLEQGGQEVRLVDNFRSTHGVVRVVNRLFSKLIPSFHPARSHREEQEGPPVEIWLYSPTDRKEDPLEAEAEAVADRIARLLQEGTEPGAIAVLFQAMTHVKTFEGALSQRGIPFQVVKGRGFFDRQEVWDCIHLLQLLTDPEDSLSWVGVLRSPLCALSDETLLRLTRMEDWVQQPDRWLEWIAEPAVERAKLARLLDLWNRWRQWAGRVPVSELMERMVRESEVREIWATTPDGYQAIANINQLIRLARQWEGAAAFSLTAWLDWLQGLIRRQTAETEAPLAPSDQNRVSLMTIHQSKGLEFPVVFLPDISRKPVSEWGEARVDRQWGLVLKVPDPSGYWKETDRWVRWRRQEAEKQRAESARLFYVAATRAERKLILSGIPQEYKEKETPLSADTWSKWLDAILGYDRINWEKGMWTFPDEEGLSLAVYTYGEPKQTIPSDRKVFLPRSSLSEPPACRWEPRGWTDADRLEVSVTELTVLANCPRRYFFAQVLAMPEGEATAFPREGPGTVPIPATVRGELVHRLLETMHQPPRSDADWIPTLRRMLAEWDFSPGRQESAVQALRPLVHTYIRSRYCQEGQTMAHILREAPFVLEKNGIKMTGTVDRLHCTHTGRWELVDWKTNDVEADEVDRLANDYLPQLQLYAIAVREQWGIPLDQVSLFFLKPDREVTFTVDEQWLAEAEQRLLRWIQMLREEVMEQFPGNPGKRCGYCPYMVWCDEAMP